MGRNIDRGFDRSVENKRNSDNRRYSKMDAITKKTSKRLYTNLNQ